MIPVWKSNVWKETTWKSNIWGFVVIYSFVKKIAAKLPSMFRSTKRF